MQEVRLKVSPPWYTFFSSVKALLGNDPDVDVIYDDKTKLIKVLVEKSDKASALTTLLPKQVAFGNVILNIQVIPANGAFADLDDANEEEIFNTAFKGNPAYAYAKTTGGSIFVYPATYVVFKNRVVQYFNDNLNDLHGLRSTLYQDLASEVFEDAITSGRIDTVYFCTDIEENIGAPDGQWP